MPDTKKKKSVAQRQSEILEVLEEQGEVSIPDLADEFGVSEMTIRRDLDRLDEVGRVRRTHGGAVPAERMVFEFDFAARRRANRSAKQAIAQKAEELIEDGQRIIIDTGTTTLELAHLLKGRSELTVITPSLAVASELQFSGGIRTILMGGEVRRGSPDLTGMVAEEVLEMFSADMAFQGADGIGMDGALYNADMRVADVDKKICQRASKTYVLADSSKFGQHALVCQGYVWEREGVITDSGLSGEKVEKMKELGANMIVVEKE